MEVRFDGVKKTDPAQHDGFKVNYAAAKRAGFTWRWPFFRGIAAVGYGKASWDILLYSKAGNFAQGDTTRTGLAPGAPGPARNGPGYIAEVPGATENGRGNPWCNFKCTRGVLHGVHGDGNSMSARTTSTATLRCDTSPACRFLLASIVPTPHHTATTPSPRCSGENRGS